MKPYPKHFFIDIIIFKIKYNMNKKLPTFNKFATPYFCQLLRKNSCFRHTKLFNFRLECRQLSTEH